MRIFLKGLLILILILILGISGFFIWKYIDFKKDNDPHKTFIYPRLEFADVEIKSFTAQKTEVLLKLLVKNQLPFGFTMDSLDYAIYISDKKIVNDKYKKTIKLIKDDSSWIYLPMIIYNDKLKTALEAGERQGRDSVEYRMKVSFYTDILIRKQFDIDITKLLPLLYIPEVELNKFKIDSINFKRAIILLDVAIKNKNKFPIELKNINYKVAIEDNEWILGKLKGVTKIKQNDITNLKIPVRLSLKELGKTIGDLLREGKDMEYKFNLDFNVVSDQNMVKDTKVLLKSEGSIRSVMDAVKEDK